MSDAITLNLKSDGPGATEATGERIGQRLRGGEVLDLASDLGGGKTTFVRGLARGAGSTDQVASPTFTVSKRYQAGELRIHHFDFYRLSEAGLMAHEVAELLEDPQNVIVVEWSGAIGHVLPNRRASISIARANSGEDDREMHIKAPASYSYLFEGLKEAGL